MRYETWVRSYKPVRNHLAANRAIDGCVFLPTGEELEFVRAQSPITVWSFSVTDTQRSSVWAIAEGFHVVNLMGYLVTEKPYDPDKVYDIRY